MSIALIGMAGAGKTSIGKVLAGKLRFSFVDTDALIELKQSFRLQDIIERFGEEEFLAIEERIILGLSIDSRTVVATGGSAIYSPKAMSFLKTKATLVFLQASYEAINRWIVDSRTRGLVGLKSKTLRQLYDERQPLYKRQADHTVLLEEGSEPEGISERIIDMVFAKDSGKQ